MTTLPNRFEWIHHCHGATQTCGIAQIAEVHVCACTVGIEHVRHEAQRIFSVGGTGRNA